MLAVHGAAQGIESIRILIIVIAILTVFFWRVMLQIVLVVVAALLLVGAITIVHDVLNIVK
jgi:fatty acid desaturase